VVGLSREKVMISSRVRIEKYNDVMELTDVHESKVPNLIVGQGKINPFEQGQGNNDTGNKGQEKKSL